MVNENLIQVIGAITILSIIFVSEARKYSVISTKVERVNLDSSVRRRPGIEWRFIVSIHDIEPFIRIVLVTLLFSYKTEGLSVLCVSRVVVASILKVLSGFLDRPSPYSHQLVSKQGCREGHDQEESRKSGNRGQSSRSGKGDQQNQVLCNFVSILQIQVRIQSHKLLNSVFFVNHSFLIKDYRKYLIIIRIWLWKKKSGKLIVEWMNVYHFDFWKICFGVIIHIKLCPLIHLNSILECPECILIEIWWQLHSKRSNNSLCCENW